MKQLRTFLFQLLLFLTLIPALQAQSLQPGCRLSGTISDPNRKSLGFATLSLLRGADSTLIKGTLSNEAGEYVFDNLKPGNYLIKAAFVGYENVLSPPFLIDGDTKQINVPALKLRPSAHTLNTVTITGSQPLIERKDGKTIINVQNSILAVGNNALEILDRAPGVSVDQNNKISLRGKQGVTIMINDKMTYLSADQLTNLLASTDGSQIASIEIITVPSAQYDASGSAGIINIKLKKNTGAGTNGTLTVGAGYGKFVKDNAGFSLNHHQGKLNLFGSFSRRDADGFEDIDLDRFVHSVAVPTTEFNQNDYIRNAPHSNNYAVGADYDVTANNTIGIGLNGYFNTSTENNTDGTLIGPNQNIIDSSLRTRSHTAYSYRNFDLNVNDRYKLDSLGQNLSIDLDFSEVHNNSNFRDTNQFFLPNGMLLHTPQILTDQTPTTIHIYVAKADYVKPINKSINLEAGAKISNVSTENDLNAQVLSNQTYIDDTSRTNHFFYKEQIYAAYLNMKGDFGKTSFQLGLRSEYTFSMGTLVDRSTTNLRYLNFFPNLNITQSLNPNDDLSFSFSRRIDRPGYEDLNPFLYYLDPYTFVQGNPLLNPQYTNEFEINYLHSHSINISFGYSHTTHAIASVVLTQGNLSFQTQRNLDDENSINIDVSVPYNPAKWWSGNADFNGFYTRYAADTLAGDMFRTGKPAFIFKTSQVLLLGLYKGEIVYNYTSPYTYSIFNFQARQNLDLGVSRSFANKHLTVKLSMSDIFNTRVYRDNSNLLNNDFTFQEHYDSRVTRLNLTYNFGNKKGKKYEQRSGADDENGRVKQSN